MDTAALRTLGQFGPHDLTPPLWVKVIIHGGVYSRHTHSVVIDFCRMIVIAHNIRSLHNIGSIFRNAAAFGVEKLYLTGFTETPPRKEIAKVALGAENLISWEKGDIMEVIAKLKQNGYHVYGLETGGKEISAIEASIRASTSGHGAAMPVRVALVLGNEVEGIDQETIGALDGLVSIPMQAKQSLNVSVASGIAMYLFTRL